MRMKSLTILFAINLFMLGFLGISAQTITYSGETMASGNFYLQNAGNGKFLKAPLSMADNWGGATEFVLTDNTVGTSKKVKIDGIVYSNGSVATTGRGDWDFSEGKNTEKDEKGNGNYVVYRYISETSYYHLQEAGNVANQSSLFTTTANYQWKLISKEQINQFDPNVLANVLRDRGYGDDITVTWESDISTDKIGENWYAYCEDAVGKCVRLRIDGLKKSKYAVEISGMSDRTADAVVECLKGDLVTSSCVKNLGTSLKTIIVPIDVPNDNGSLSVYVNTGLIKQNVWGVVNSIRKIEDSEFNDLMVTWSPETATAGDFFIYNPKTQTYLKSGKTYARGIADATIFNVSGTQNASITYKDGAQTKYVDNRNWTSTAASSTASWDIALQSTYGTKRYSVQNASSSKYLNCADDNTLSTVEALGANSVWTFISKDQYSSVYPTDRVRTMLNKNDVVAEREFSAPFETGVVNNIWVTKQGDAGTNNRYVVSNLTDGKYVVEIYASKGRSINDAYLYVNGQSQVLTSSLQVFTYNVTVVDGTIEIYEDAPVGAGTLSLAIKNITTATEYHNKFINILTGEEVRDNTSYYINSVEANSYITSYNSKTNNIDEAAPFVFTSANGAYKVANGSANIGFDGLYNSLKEDDDAWNFASAGVSSDLGRYYEVYIKDNVGSSKYFFWKNNGGNLSLAEHSNTALHTGNKAYQYRMISKAQYETLFPQDVLRTSLFNENVDVAREFATSLKMYEHPTEHVWMLKETVAGKTGEYLKITINNLVDDKYVVDMYGMKVGTGLATIKIHNGKETVDMGNLNTTLGDYSLTTEITGGTLIIYVSAGLSVDEVYAAIKNITLFSEQDTEDNFAKITWSNETAQAGNFRIYHPRTHTFLSTPGILQSKLSGYHSVLFTLSGNQSTTISYDDNGTKKYIYQKNGDGAWSTSQQTWTLSSSNGGYTIENDNRYIQYNTDHYLQYVRNNWQGKSDSWSNNDADRVWYFISEDQYDAIAPAAIAKKYSSLGTGVSASWESEITTAKQGGNWMAKSNGNTAGKYNQITITGLKDGFYDVIVAAGIGNGTAAVTVESKNKATRALYPGHYYSYSVPVTVADGTLKVYVETTGQVGDVYSVIKKIVPVTSDKGVMDTYIKNPYFAIPQGARTWDKDWTIDGFEAAVNSEATGFGGYGIHAEITGKMDQHEGTKSVSQILNLSSGSYVLSADVFTSGRIGHIYAKVNGETYKRFCNGPKNKYQLEFVVPSSDTDVEVEVGFFSDTNGYNDPDNNNAYTGIDWNNQFTVAVDNFHLSYTDDYLKNADFSDGLTNWTASQLTVTDNSNQISNNRHVAVNTNNGQIAAGYVQQVVTLPAGAYTLSGYVSMPFGNGHFFAKIGDREQKSTFGEKGLWAKRPREFSFVVPVESQVTVGFRYDEVTTAISGGSGTHVAADNFHLVRIGDAEGAEITSQIVNNDFSIAKDNLGNQSYGWERTGSSGFLDYSYNTAEAYYEQNNSKYTKWNNYTISQVISGLPDGWYKIEAQGYYRDGSKGSASQNRAQALLFANDSYTGVKLITDIEPNTSLYGNNDGGYPNSMQTASSAFENNPDKCVNELTVHVKNGEIELGVKRTDAINQDWLIMNYFRLFYLYEENVFADVSHFIKNPSFETGTTVEWNRGNISNEKATKITGTNPGWDQNYYYSVTTTNTQEQSLYQTIKGLPAGEYEISVQVKSGSSTDVILYGDAADEATTKLSSTKSSAITTISGTVIVQEGQNLTIKVGSKGKFDVDNFSLSKASAEVYLYNADAGAFLGKKIESGYIITDKSWDNPVGLSTDGTLLRMTMKDDIVTFRDEATNDYMHIKRMYSSMDEYKYLFYTSEASPSNTEFKMTQLENSSLCYLGIDPANLKYGSNAKVENTGAAERYIGKYGTTYMGWSGEPGFDVVLPLIPSADITDKGVKWQVLTTTQYTTYKDVVAAAYSARMEAWPILCAARRSALKVDYTQFETVYYNVASTAQQIQAYAQKVKDKILSESTLNAATQENYVDLTFMINDAECNQRNLTWTNADGLFYVSESSDYTATKSFGGRHYEAFNVDGIADTEFYTELKGLPSGRYIVKLTTSAYANGNNVVGAAAFARNNFGDSEKAVGSTLFAIQETTIPVFNIDANNQTVKIGIKLNGTNAKYVAIDDIRILYLGGTNSDVFEYGYSSENGVLKLFGKWPDNLEAKEYLSKVLNGSKSVCAISLKETGFAPEFDVTINGDNFTNKNLLVYKNGSQAHISVTKVNNLVVEGVCTNYVLVDKNDAVIPYQFTANSASYTRSVSSDYGTLCLPFTCYTNDDIQLFNFSDFIVDGGVVKIGLTQTSSISACTPCVFKRKDSSNGTISISFDSPIVVSNATAKSVSNTQGYKLVGSFKKQTFGDPTGVDKTAANEYYYIAKDKFWHGTDYFNNGAFRAYIFAGDNRITDGKISSARSITFFEWDGEEPETTSVEDIEDDVTIIGYFNVKGQKIDEPQQGVNFIKYSDGKTRKIFVK